MRDDVGLIGSGSGKVEFVRVDGYDYHLIIRSILVVRTPNIAWDLLTVPFCPVLSRSVPSTYHTVSH